MRVCSRGRYFLREADGSAKNESADVGGKKGYPTRAGMTHDDESRCFGRNRSRASDATEKIKSRS